MAKDRLLEGLRLQVVHEPGFGAHTPKRRRTQFVLCVLRSYLNNAIPGTHIMEQEVAKRMNDLAPQGVRDGEGPAIDHGSGRSGDDGTDMADAALNLGKELLTGFNFRLAGQHIIARWNQGAADELGKVVNSKQTRLVRFILGIRRRLADRCDIHGLQTVGDAYFIEVSVGGEGQNAAVLILPTKAAHAHFPRCLQDGYLDGLTMDQPVTLFRLFGSNVDQCLVINRLDEAVSQGIERGSQCANVFAWRQMLLCLGADRTVVNERTACDQYPCRD